MITSHNSIGALALGNGEVDSSILSGSTISPNNNNNLEHKRRNANHQPFIESPPLLAITATLSVTCLSMGHT